MDIIVFLSPLLPMSGNLVDFVFVCHFVIRRRCHKLWSWSKIKLYSGNVDCRMRSRVGGEPECDGIRSDFGDLEWSIRNRGKFPLFAFLPFQQYLISFYDQCSSRSFPIRVSALDLLCIVYCISSSFLQTQQVSYLVLSMWIVYWFVPGNAGWVMSIIEVKGGLTSR